MHTVAADADRNEAAILARVLGNGEGRLPADVARYILTLNFDERDKARMHALAAGNQEDTLSAPEKEELIAYAKAGSLLSLLKSKARRALDVKPGQGTGP